MNTILFRHYKLFAIGLISLAVLLNLHCKKTDAIKTDEIISAASSQSNYESMKTIEPVEFVVDQSNTVLTNRFSYNINFAPVGQEFTPSLYALDAIELNVEDASCSLAGSTGGNLKLALHEGTITGNIIGCPAAACLVARTDGHIFGHRIGISQHRFPSVSKRLLNHRG